LLIVPSYVSHSFANALFWELQMKTSRGRMHVLGAVALAAVLLPPANAEQLPFGWFSVVGADAFISVAPSDLGSQSGALFVGDEGAIPTELQPLEDTNKVIVVDQINDQDISLMRRAVSGSQKYPGSPIPTASL